MYPYVNEKGIVELIIGYGVDITERIKIEQQLKIAQQETQEAALAKERFLANMSHEIRTPMNGILGITGFLEKTHLLPKQKEYVHLIKESTSNLLVILNDVLDLEKIIAGKLELEKTPFNVSQKIKAAAESFRHKAEEKYLTIKYKNNLPENLFVEGDPYRLSQVLLNLISNAIKFTEKGTITIGADIKQQSKNTIEISFFIADTGVGIAKNKLTQIFDPYVQAKADISRKYGGTGLGLSICKNLVEIQNGNITVESKEGKGSTFNFTITYKKAKQTTEPKPIVLNFKGLKNKNILVAEDVEVNQYVIENMLKNWGCKTTIVDTGKKAVQAVKSKSFDLILMDVQMPEMNGFEATEAIRKLSNKQKANLPVIAVTANSMKGISSRYKSSGMNDYILKPFDEASLFAVMEKFLLSKYPSKKIGVKKAMVYDAAKIKALAKGDDAFIKKLSEIFTRTSPQIFKALQEAIAEKNWQQAGKEAHKLKSSINSLGISDGKKLIEDIEQRCKTKKQLSTVALLCNKFKIVLDKSIEQLTNNFLN